MNKSSLMGLLGFVMLVITSCAQGEAKRSAPKPAVLAVETVKEKEVTVYKEYATNIEGQQNVEIRAKVDGFIKGVYIDEGDIVKKGQLLFKLDAENLSQQLNAAKASVTVAEAQVAVVRVEFEKVSLLVSKKIIGAVELQTSQSKLGAAKAQLAAAKASYLNAKQSLSYAHITSPVNGIVGSLPYKIGSLVGRNEKMPLTTVSNIDNVYAYFTMSEKQLLTFIRSVKGESMQEKINQMPVIDLYLADGSLYEEKGKIETINGMVNPRTGSVSYRAKFKNTNQLLRNGNSGLLKFPSTFKNAMVIPQKASFEIQGQRFVYIVDKDNKIQSKAIDVSENMADKMIVSKGLSVGDVVVVEGVMKLKGGMEILPKK